MRVLSVSVAILAASASASLAADLIIETPVDVIVESSSFDWTGAYVGAGIGYGVGTVDVTDTSGGVFDEDVGESLAVDASGFLANLTAGANWQMDALVLGVEGQVGYLGGSAEEYIVESPDNFGEVDLGVYGDVTARLGFAVDQALFYVKGGLAGAQVDATFGDLVDDTGEPDEDSTASHSGFAVGWTVGAGIEFAIDDNWSAKAEYQYYDLGSYTITDINDDEAEADITAQTVKFGVNYRF